MKQVPDTANVRMNPETNTLMREGVESIANPFDEYALEQALALKDSAGATVTVDISKRPDALREFAESAEPFVIVWSEAPDATVKFKPDAATRSKGYKLKPRTIEVAVEGSETPVEKSGLALFNAGGSVLIIR